MKIQPPGSIEELEALRENLQRALPPEPNGRWCVMIYQSRWGWVARAQFRKSKPAKVVTTPELPVAPGK
jgi:hypothetical protein